MADPNVLGMENPNDPEAVQRNAQELAALTKLLLQMSGGGALGQIGGINPYQQQNFVGPFATAVGAPGPQGQGSLAPTFGPSGMLFAGGSPFPVDYGPARLQNTLVGIRDLLMAANAFKDSPLGKWIGGKLGGGEVMK